MKYFIVIVLTVAISLPALCVQDSSFPAKLIKIFKIKSYKSSKMDYTINDGASCSPSIQSSKNCLKK